MDIEFFPRVFNISSLISDSPLKVNTSRVKDKKTQEFGKIIPDLCSSNLFKRDVDKINMTDLEVIQFISFKMFYAVTCGAIVGYERRLNHAPAGFKTQILVCVGAMLFSVSPTIAGAMMVNETPRVIGQIVTGVGFLGAGAIMHNKTNSVSGLTTAAWIWFTAAIGIIIGLGHGPVGIFVTATLTAVIVLVRKIEMKYFGPRNLKVETDQQEEKEPPLRKVG
jgi:putative Mg2+ transporter-C (MgtC) family protein